MAVQTRFVVSVIGQDAFYNGFGGVSYSINDAVVYNGFQAAQEGVREAANSDRTFGYQAWEIRTILVGGKKGK
jgi:hypothetical protein